MNDHKFSNQKSALEDYFESLLGEMESDDSEDNTVTAESAKSQNNISEVVNDTSRYEVSPQDAKDNTPEKEAEVAKRNSVADMLATIEEKITETSESVTANFAEPAAKISMPLPDVAPEIETEVVIETEVTEKVVAEVKEVETEIQDQAAEVAPVIVPVKSENVIPEWAESPFQCLLFNVGGLSLAVPLVRLNGVIPWSENVVETPNQTDWYLGVLMNHGNKVQVIDTAVMVLPPEHRIGMPDDPAERFSHILLVDDQRWGLACDSIGDVVWLKNTDVKWRSDKTKRPWLLGTAIDHMCAVMDTEAFADMLEGKK